MGSKRAFVIDSDFGIDDACAILAMAAHDDVDIRAITVVDGNVPCEVGLANARQVLLRFHDAHLQQEGDVQIRPEPAASALVDIVTAEPNTVTILAIGPLTNIALAICLRPDFLSLLKGFVIMGGCLGARGNSNRVAEFDPEAAHVVFEAAARLSTESPSSAGPLVTLVPWETTVDHALTWDEYDALMDRETPASVLVKNMVHFYGSRSRSLLLKMLTNERTVPVSAAATVVAHARQAHQTGSHGFVMCDLYAALVALDARAIEQYQDWDVKIELGGTLSRGLVALNWMFDEPHVNARVVLAVKKDALFRLLRKLLL
ncbi:hypothetical protein HK405_003314 [Cladochytrium tenue]|nr:hypothetical protein HK405_003314 [Cladochytrium tenue]